MSDRTQPPPGWWLEEYTVIQPNVFCVAGPAPRTKEHGTREAAIAEAWKIFESMNVSAADKLTAEDWDAYADAAKLAICNAWGAREPWERLIRIARSKARDLRARGDDHG